jgi:carboxypeptidase D
MWEAYYNAGSAALALGLIFIGILTFFWCRRRGRRGSKASVALPTDGREEESIPLHSADELRSRRGGMANGSGGNGKGKERAMGSGMEEDEGLKEPIFDVGEHSDDEDGMNAGSRYRDKPE